MQTNGQHDDEAKLKRAVEENSRRESFCELTVVVALVFEAVVLLQYSGNKPPLETALLIACTLLLAIAINGEIRFGSERSKAQTELQRLSDERVATSMAEAEQAKARAAEAKKDADEARLETEKVRLEFAKFRAPRELSPEQIERIADTLRPFSGTQYDAALSANDPEFLDLLEFIETALEKAG